RARGRDGGDGRLGGRIKYLEGAPVLGIHEFSVDVHLVVGDTGGTGFRLLGGSRGGHGVPGGWRGEIGSSGSKVKGRTVFCAPSVTQAATTRKGRENGSRDTAGTVRPASPAVALSSRTCHGIPNRVSRARKGSGSICSGENTPAPAQSPEEISSAATTGGIPVWYAVAWTPSSA